MERTNDEILETEKGFITYRYIENAKSVYIIDLYVKPEFRNSHEASQMADAVCKEAKERGFTKLLGSVVPSNKGSTSSLKVLLAYGMRLQSSTNDFIFFEKEI